MPGTGSAEDWIHSPVLTINHITAHSACNLACPYCIGTWKSAKNKFHYPTLKAVLDRIRAIPRPVNLILAQWGEFFTSKPLMKETTRLCNSPGNLSGVSILTNLQADWDKVIRPFADGLDTGRLAMGCTLHDRVITAEDIDRFFEKVERLYKMGVLVYVNYVLFGAYGIVQAQAHKKRCEAIGVPLTLMPLFPRKPHSGSRETADFSHEMTSWSAEALKEIKPLCDSLHTYKMYFDARTTLGMKCGAGRDYLYIDAAGDIFPCCGKSDSPIGNILRDGINVRKEDAVCGKQLCICPYDVSALRIVEHRYIRDRDFRLIRPREGVSTKELESGYGMPLRMIKAATRLADQISSKTD